LCDVNSTEGESDETGSEDESIKYDTIKKSDLRKNKPDKSDTDENTASIKPTESSEDVSDVLNTVSDSVADVKLDITEAKNIDINDEPDGSTEKKLSPSEEIVCPLVEQIVSQSVSSETSEDKDEEEDKIIAVNETAAAKTGKTKGKKQTNKNSPKKTGKK